MPIDYENFVVQIDQVGSDQESRLSVRVVQSPAGESRGEFHLPENVEKWFHTLVGLSPAERSSGRWYSYTQAAESPHQIGQQFGEALFSALLSGPAASLWERSLSSGIHRGFGLRLRLRISVNAESPWYGVLHSLPWELLCHPTTGDFLALRRETPIVRSLEVPRPSLPVRFSLPLRVLVVPTSPPWVSHDVEAELRQISERLRNDPRVEVSFLAQGGASNLRLALLERRIDILHFTGHSGFDPKTGAGILFLQEDGLRAVAFSGQTLAALLRDIQNVRLVVLDNLCDESEWKMGISSPNADLARSLVLGGLPAAIAIQFPWPSLHDASIFSGQLYRRLAVDDVIEEALTEARQALHVASPDSAHWAAPALFSRIAEGRLFAQHSAPASSPRGVSLFTKVLGRLLPAKEGPAIVKPDKVVGYGSSLTSESVRESSAGLASGPAEPYEVFLSYSHDSPEHMRRVLELSNSLRHDGVDVWIDQYEQSPPEGWPIWAARRTSEARFVLVICTKNYARRFLGGEGEGQGLGARWEGHVVVQELYESGGYNAKFIPVVFSPDDRPNIPSLLRGVTHYDLSQADEYWRLYGHITEQQERAAPPLGKRVPLPPLALRAHFDRPLPNYPSEQVKVMAESLAVARSRLKEMAIAGKDTAPILEEIRRLRIELREGGRLQPGDFLAEGNYHLIEILGRGGFATVWKAWDEERQQLVALKVLHGLYADDRTLLDRFFRGARKMTDLRHPGVVRVLEERLEDGGYHYFVMEFIAGGDLHKAVLIAKLSTCEILSALLTVGETLSFAHAQGVIHRDIKPANILLGSDGPKLTDFDLVHAADTEGFTQTNAMIGTLFYTPPEVLLDAKEVTEAADIYSLAMTVIFALSGRELPIDIIRRPERVVETLPCSSSLKNHLLLSISWDDPKERPSSMADFCKKLAEELRITEATGGTSSFKV